MRDWLIDLIESSRYWGSGTSEEIADYLLANGVIVPPAPFGSKVYIPVIGANQILNTEVCGFGIDEDGYFVINPDEYPKGVFGINGYIIGKTVFLTKEEAEKALAEMRNGDAD